MVRLNLLTLGLLAALSTPAAQAAFITTGTYDSTGNSNAVDRNASGNPLASTLPTDVAGFKANVNTAYLAGLGGVVNFDTSSLSSQGTTGITNFDASFAGGSKSLLINSSITHNTAGGSVAQVSGAQGISGDKLLVSTNSSGNGPDFTWSFSPIVGGTNEFVKQIAFTAMSRDSAGYPKTYSITAFYSDNTSEMIDYEMPAGTATGDTFFSFLAPGNASILSFTVDAPGSDTNSDRLYIDDFAFITHQVVPEPSSVLLLALGLIVGGFTLRRRSKRSRP